MAEKFRKFNNFPMKFEILEVTFGIKFNKDFNVIFTLFLRLYFSFQVVVVRIHTGKKYEYSSCYISVSARN